jgi:hypothetical protein
MFLSSVVQIKSFTSNPSHSATVSQSFQLSVKIFSQSALVGECENISSPLPEPALGGPDLLSHFLLERRMHQITLLISMFQVQGCCYTCDSSVIYLKNSVCIIFYFKLGKTGKVSIAKLKVAQGA